MGTDVRLLPISASDVYSISDNEITLEGGGQRVLLEVFLDDGWPELLKAFEAGIDSVGYSSGLKGTLAPPVVDCTADPSVCATEIGSGSLCPFPPTVCPAGFIDTGRADYIFFGQVQLGAVDISTLNYRYGATLMGAPIPYPGGVWYLGSLVLDVPVGAMGTFTIEFIPDPGTTLLDQNGQFIPLTTHPALITVTCQSNEDCDDGLYCNGTETCTDGVCVGGAGDPCPGPDGDADCAESCNETADNCTASDPIDSGCDFDGLYCSDDTCDGAGTCDPGGDPCPGPDGDADCSESCNEPADDCTANDPDDSPCDDGEFCTGTETCTGGFCGNATGNPCPGPDGDGDCAESCDEDTNDCQEADPDGSSCNDGQYCNENEACTGGVCGDGTDTDCDDGLPCTDDGCDELNDTCVNALTAGYCLITDLCYADGELSPDDDCQECNPAISTTDWSFRPAGSECDDGDPCTGTGRENIDDDTCDGAGECAGEPDPECNDQCAFAIEAVEGITPGNNEGSSPDDDVEALCQPDSNNDVWFVYTAICTGTTFVSTTGSEFAPANDPVLSIYDACPDQGGAEIACDDDSGAGLQAALTFATVAADTPYWIRVAGFEDSAGSIALNIEPFDECLIDGVCYPEGAINAGNDCEACIPEVATMAWTPRSEGATCGDETDTDCNGYDACDGAGVCEPNYKVEGSACGDLSDTECDNPDTCDGVGECLPNYEVRGTACGNPDDTQCDNPDICDDMGLCDDNFEVDGAPCNDENVCTEDDVCDTGLCVGTPIPQAPVVISEGPRHLEVTPQPVGSVAPVALLVTSPDWTCVSNYIQADGLLGPDPVFQLPDEWDTVAVQSPDLVPSSTYDVVAECGTYTSAPGSATTAIFGDIVGEATAGEWGAPDGRVDVLDLTAIVEAFRHLPTAPGQERSDLWPCTPDGVIDVLDMTMVADAFQGYSYWETTGCPVPCP